MAVYKVLNKVKTASGYDILNPMTPFDVLSCSSVSISGTTIACTTNIPAEAFLVDQDFTVAFAIPSSPAGVTAISVNSTSYTMDTRTQTSMQSASVGDVVMLYVDVSASQAHMFNLTSSDAAYATNAGHADTADSADSADSVPANGVTGVLTVAQGGTGAGDVTGAKTNLGFATKVTYTGTLTTTWSGTGPYQQTVNITGILSNDEPVVDVTLTGTAATDTPRLEGWGCIGRITTAVNSITFACYDSAPTVELPFRALYVK